MTQRDRIVRYLFLICYLYLGITVSLGLIGVAPESTSIKMLLNIVTSIVVLAVVGLFVLIVVRLYKSAYSGPAKVFWYTIMFFTNFFGATAFYLYDAFRNRRPSEP